MNEIKLVGSVGIQAAAPEGKPRTFSGLGYGGDPMNVGYPAPVVIDLKGLRIKRGLPLLVEHERGLDNAIGSVSTEIRDNQLWVSGTLATNEAANKVVALGKDNVPLSLSVGISPGQLESIAPGKSVVVNGRSHKAGVMGLLVLRSGELVEVSIVTVPADSQSFVNIQASRRGTMEFNTYVTNAGFDPANINDAQRSFLQAAYTVQQSPSADAILATERARVTEIDRAVKGDWGDHSDYVASLRASAVSGAISTDVLRAQMLSLIRSSRPNPGLTVHGGDRNYATSKDHLAVALMVRAGFESAAEKHFGARVMEQSRPLHSQSLPDLCRASFMIDGRDAPHTRGEMIRASISGGSLSVALGDSANLLIQLAYTQAPAAWPMFAGVKSAANFKVQTSVRGSFIGDLELTARGAPVAHAQVGEETYEWQVKRYSRQLVLAEEDIIDDSLRILSESSPALGRAGARTLNTLVAETILANAGDFWSTANLNYFEGAATNLQASSLASAIKFLRQQTNAEGDYLDLGPACLLVPAELEYVAKELLSSAEVARYTASGTDRAATGNPMQNVAVVAVEPRLSDSALTGYSTTAWWLFSAANNDGVIVGFRDGIKVPRVEFFGMDAHPDRYVISYRCAWDVATALGDFRASVKSKGAA